MPEIEKRFAMDNFYTTDFFFFFKLAGGWMKQERECVCVCARVHAGACTCVWKGGLDVQKTASFVCVAKPALVPSSPPLSSYL